MLLTVFQISQMDNVSRCGFPQDQRAEWEQNSASLKSESPWQHTVDNSFQKPCSARVLATIKIVEQR